MFNKITRWFKNNQPLINFIYFIIGVYIAFHYPINKGFSNFFTNKLNIILNTNLTIGGVILIAIGVLLIRFMWRTFRIKEIKILKAKYYSAIDPSISIDIVDKIQKLVNQNILDFQISNIVAGKDPKYGHPKVFEIEYKIGKKIYNKKYEENQIVTLI